jgi:prophage endopeptidase
MIPRSWMIIGAGLVVAGVYAYAHHAGYAERDLEMQVEIARLNDVAREKEQQLASAMSTNQTKLMEANNAITEKQSALDRAIRAGRVRLNTSCVQASPGAPAPAGNRDEAGSESDRQTLAAIAAIVAQGDRNTEQLNACIDAYNQMKEAVNGQR